MKASNHRQSGAVMWVILAVLVLGGLGLWQYESSKRRELDAAMKQINDAAHRWDDAIKVAAATARISLPQQVTNMQAIRRDVDALKVPACLNEPKQNLIYGMDATIQGYLTFMENKDGNGEKLAKLDFDQARTHMEKFKTIKAKC